MKISCYQEGDEIKILELFKIVYAKELDIEFWKWRFSNAPNFNPHMIQLMWDGNKLVGHYAVSPAQLSVNGKTNVVGLSMTTMTHPDYTRRGVFTKLASELYSKIEGELGISIVYGFPNANSYPGFISKLGWQEVDQIKSLRFDGLNNKESISSNTGNFRKVESFSEINADTYNSILKGYNVSLFQSVDRLSWRYLKCPTYTYNIYSDLTTGEFLVSKTYVNNGVEEVDLVELAVHNKKANIEAAIKCVLENEEINTINCWMPKIDKRYNKLTALGFNETEITTNFCILNKEHLKVTTTAFYYQMGDSDVY